MQMTPDAFRDQWCDDEDEELILFTEEALAGISLPEDSREFLISAGLPDSAAPFLDFRAPDVGQLPNVAESWQQGAEFRRYRIIGSNGSGDPVCIDEAENGQVVYLNHDFNFKRVFINSSIPTLAESLLMYRKCIRDVQERNGEDAWLDGDIPAEILESINEELKRIDPAGIQSECFWSFELEQLLEEQE